MDELLHDVEEAVAGNAEKVCQLHDIIDKIKTEAKNGADLQSEIIGLVKGNDPLVDRIKQAAVLFEFGPISSRLVKDLLEHLKPQISSEYAAVERFASIFLNGILPFRFLQMFVKRCVPDSAEADAKLDAIREEADDGGFRTGLQFSKVDGSEALRASRPVSLLIGIGALIDEAAEAASAVKCLKLYSFGFISKESAVGWLEAVHPFVREVFAREDEVDKADFLPSRVFECVAAVVSENQLRWVFGSTLCGILAAEPKFSARNQIQLSNEVTLQENLKPKNIDRSGAEEISKLQSAQFFYTLRKAVSGMRDGKTMESVIPQTLIDSVFGQNCPIGRDPRYWGVFFEKIKSLGGVASRDHIGLLDRNVSVVDPSSCDGRIAYKARYSKDVIIRDLFFNGASFATPKNILEQALSVAENTVHCFTKLGEKYDKLAAVFKGEMTHCDERGAIALCYFMELVRVIGLLDSANASVSDIPRLIMEEHAPLSVFNGEPAANVDIILLAFVKSLRRAHYGDDWCHFRTDFMFRVDVRHEEVIVSRGIMNAVSD